MAKTRVHPIGLVLTASLCIRQDDRAPLLTLLLGFNLRLGVDAAEERRQQIVELLRLLHHQEVRRAGNAQTNRAQRYPQAVTSATSSRAIGTALVFSSGSQNA
jgi:hypothetical protein